MLSQKARYALRALIILGQQVDGETLLISEIAAKAGIPRKFLEQILLELKKWDFVASRRGKLGGYFLAQAPEKINFAAVIRAMDGPLELAPCVSHTVYRPCDNCDEISTCPIRHALLRVYDCTTDVLENWTLCQALGQPIQQGLKRRSGRRAASHSA
jgi:Rrf2 family protein